MGTKHNIKMGRPKKITNKKPTGLGDVVEKVTEKTGIKKVVKAVFGDDCGCNERKVKYNNLFQVGTHKARRCLTEDQYISYGEYIQERKPNIFQVNEVGMLIDLYAHVFAIQYDRRTFCTNCAGSAKRLKTIQDRLDVIYKSYND